MDTQEALELFTQLVEEKFNKKITEPQRILFQGFWVNLSYEEIKKSNNVLEYYSETYLREVGSNLRELVFKICGQKVNKKSFRAILECYLKEQASNQTGSSIIKHWNLHNRFFELSRQAKKRDWYSPEDYLDFDILTQQMVDLIKEDEKYRRYEEIAERWKLIKNFTHVYNQFWKDREQLLRWLMQGAKYNNDYPLIAEVFSELGLTLVLLYPHEKAKQSEAEYYLTKARKLTKSQEFNLWVDVNINIAILSLAQQQPDNAAGHLVTAAKSLSEQWTDGNLRNRCLSNLHYYEGECNFQLQNFREADKQYKLSTEYAKGIGWQRAEVATNNWRAEIAMQLDNLKFAESLLTKGLNILRTHQDYHCNALHYRSLAWLNQEQGNKDKALVYATQAQLNFQNSGMNVEAGEMQNILDSMN